MWLQRIIIVAYLDEETCNYITFGILSLITGNKSKHKIFITNNIV